MPQLPAEPEPPWKATAQALADHPPEVPEPPMLARIVGEHDLGWWCGQMVQAVTWCIGAIQQLQTQQAKLQSQIQVLQTQEKSDMATLADLTAAVEAEKTVDASIETLITGLAQQIADLKSKTNLSPADQAVLDKEVADLQAEKTALAAAVTANTPDAPAT